MEWIDELRGELVAVDTMAVIYLIEEHPIYLPIVRPLFAAMDQGLLRAVTSTLTVLEVLVHPKRRREVNLTQRYRDILLHSRGLDCIPLSSTIAEKAAELRSQENLRTPDAIQLATALHAHASHFVTNDARLPSVGGVTIVQLDDLRTQSPSERPGGK